VLTVAVSCTFSSVSPPSTTPLPSNCRRG
jgi:hypothetical protein